MTFSYPVIIPKTDNPTTSELNLSGTVFRSSGQSAGPRNPDSLKHHLQTFLTHPLSTFEINQFDILRFNPSCLLCLLTANKLRNLRNLRTNS